MGYDGRTHVVQIGNLTRELPLFRVASDVNIAIFNMLGDTEAVEVSADELVKKLPGNAEVLIVPEVKAVPLGHALSVRSGLPLAVVRKIRKPYMVNCVDVEVVTITTGVPQTLYLDGKDRGFVHSKNAVLVDDVVSTGNTLEGLHKLTDAAGATVVGEMAVFIEGGPGEWPHVIALGRLPVFADA